METILKYCTCIFPDAFDHPLVDEICIYLLFIYFSLKKKRREKNEIKSLMDGSRVYSLYKRHDYPIKNDVIKRAVLYEFWYACLHS
jgi:hypothetical protein